MKMDCINRQNGEEGEGEKKGEREMYMRCFLTQTAEPEKKSILKTVCFEDKMFTRNWIISFYFTNSFFFFY